MSALRSKHTSVTVMLPVARWVSASSWTGLGLSSCTAWTAAVRFGRWCCSTVLPTAAGRWVCKTHHCLVDGAGSVDARRPAARRGARAGAHALMHPREGLERSRAVIDLLVRDELIAAPRLEPERADRRDTTDCGRSRRARGVAEGPFWHLAARSTMSCCVRRPARCARCCSLAARSRRTRPVKRRRRTSASWEATATASSATRSPRCSSTCRRPRPTRCGAGAQGRRAGARGQRADRADRTCTAGAPRRPCAHAVCEATVQRHDHQRPRALPRRLYAFGSTMVDVVPIVPLASEHALGILVVSYAGGMTFGVCADRGTVPTSMYSKTASSLLCTS